MISTLSPPLIQLARFSVRQREQGWVFQVTLRLFFGTHLSSTYIDQLVYSFNICFLLVSDPVMVARQGRTKVQCMHLNHFYSTLKSSSAHYLQKQPKKNSKHHPECVLLKTN